MQKIYESLLNILCSSLVNMVSDCENNFMQNKYKWMRYLNILHRHQK